jgi:GNAT superfamily N-acetyltransferase
MSISFSEVHHPDEFINRELRVMARHSTKTSRTTWYRACRDGEEVAFLAIGLSGEHLFPYQLVVPRELRGRGIGSAVLCAVERLAQSEGFERVRVWPRPLDDSLDQWRLERWYCERGYEIVTDGTGDMEKRISLQEGQMSALGQKRTSDHEPGMSAFLLKADVRRA